MIEMGKKYRTRDGREVRIYAVYDTGHWCVHGAIKSNNDGLFWPHQWTRDGLFQSVASNVDCYGADLIEVKPEVTVREWVLKSRATMGLTTSCLSEIDGFDTLGQIAITHDGEKLIRVEIV